MVLKFAPDARVVYVDIDPMVSAHAAALLTGGDSTAFVQADLRDPDAVLGSPELRKLIDLAEPVGLLMTAVMHFVTDADDPWGVVAATWPRLLRAAMWRFPPDPGQQAPPGRRGGQRAIQPHAGERRVAVEG